MKKILLILVSSILLFSCGEPTINGKVIDNFNKPVSDFNVAIKGTSLKTKTNSNGKFSIDFVPGNDIKILFTKKGYTKSEVSVNISTKDDYPLETINTFKVPNTETILFMGENDYVEIPNSKIVSDAISYYETIRAGNGFDIYASFKGRNYYAKIDDNKIPTFKSGNVKFADTSPLPISLVKLEKSNDKYKILTFSYPTEGYNQDFRYVFNSNDKTFKKYRKISSNYIKTEYKDLTKINNEKPFGIRPYTLEKGYYAFYINSKNSKNPIEKDYVLAFKIE